MKVNLYINQPVFKGRREDRNTVSQLKNNNNYALNEPNQRKINQAIENLANYPGEENLDFILDVADNLKYGTNIETGKQVKNDWKNKLKNAAENSLAHSNPILEEKYRPQIERIFNTKKSLTEDEKSILAYKNSILEKTDLDALKETTDENIRSLERNMDYFVISTEIPIEQKLYVLKRLDYFMGPDYNINPQLKDKKTQILAEMMNDLTINTKESKIPNIKAINQKNHGMCAAISITRKAIAYEDKPNYVDSLLSELDDTDKVMIYDRFNLGSGKRIPVQKVYLDYDYAQAKGYRIVDAAATQWMNIANMYGINNENMEEYNPFDKNNFDALQDAHFNQNFENQELMKKQCNYQALLKAQDTIGTYKSVLLKRETIQQENHSKLFQNIELNSKYHNSIKNELKNILPDMEKAEVNTLLSKLISLEKNFSDEIDKEPFHLRQYCFIPNEEDSQKVKKVKQYLIDNTCATDDAALNKAAKNIAELIEESYKLSEKIKPASLLSKKIATARLAYEAEAAYRASILVGFGEPDVLTDKLIKYNIPDRETRISEGIDKLINLVETGNSPELTEHLSKLFQFENPDKTEVLNALNAVKANYESNMTALLDELYRRLGLGSRKECLLDEIQVSKNEIKAGKKAKQSRVAECLGINDAKKDVLKALEHFEKQLSDPDCDEKTYIDIMNKAGYKNQTDLFITRYQAVLSTITNPNDSDYEENNKILREINDLDENATADDMLNLFRAIGETFNGVSQDIEIAANIINSCRTAESNLLSSNDLKNKLPVIEAKDILISQMEKRGELIPESEMRKLQDRFTKIDKIRSQDEFSSRQGKISDPSLYKLTESEKNSIKNINKKLNKMYSEVTRALKYQYREIKPQLEELNRYIGTNEGKYWMIAEGHSGLYSPQQVKIFEQITDRPYYAEEDIDTAVDKILNGVHSGVSSTNVFHDRIGKHAQYVADIKKVGPQQKYALFHDNTWGASEHENVWIDSQGITRTDYSDRRGGETGYITDETWKNGNYIEELLNKKGKISPEIINNKVYKKINPTDNSEYNFSLISDIIINGKNPAYKTIAGGIKDTIYIPDSNWISSFEKILSGMTKGQIERANLGLEAARTNYQKQYKEIMKRIEKKTFNPGINSREEYENLPDDDKIKITFEKIAAQLAYPNFYMSEELAKAKSLSDIQKIKDKLKTNAKNDFYYAFGKDKNILLYYAYEHSRKVSGKLIEILNNNNVKYEYDIIPKIFNSTAAYTKEEESQFTGSIKDSINFVINKTMKQFDENIPPTEESLKAREEFKTYLTDFLNEIMYFNTDDLKSMKFRAQAVRKWIDKTFDPVSDEKFVEIYRKLQDMTTEEFNTYTTNLTDEDLGIKPITGYDVLVKVKAANDKAETQLMNRLFLDEYVQNINLSKTKPIYKYGKNQKSLRGAIYTNGRSFDDIYLTFLNAMRSLEYEKMFNVYKDINYRRYNAMPSYPKVELVKESSLNSKLNDVTKLTTETLVGIKSRKNIMNTIHTINKLKEYIGKIPDDKPLNKKEFAILNTLIGEYLTNNFTDPDAEAALNAAYQILQADKGTPAKDFKTLINVIAEDYKTVEKINERHPFKESNKENMESLQNYYNELFNFNIPKRYRRLLREDLDNWIREEFKKRDNSLGSRYTAYEIRAKLDEFGIKNNTKGKLENFTKLQNAIYAVKLLTNSGNIDKQELKSMQEELNNAAGEYINKYVKPEYKQQAQKFIKKWINNEIHGRTNSYYNPQMSQAAKNKFEHDFKKYHYSKQPVELFKDYMMSAVKDSPDAKYKESHQKFLLNFLDLSKLIDIQESLMEAVQTGNAAEVRNYFKDYYVNPYNSPFPQTMDSEESLSYMVRALLVDNNFETAKMFVEKLGLAERLIDFEYKQFDTYEPEKIVKKIVNIAKSTQANMLAARTEFNKLEKIIDTTDDFEKAIEETKANIIKATKRNNRKSEVKAYLEALDNTKKDILQKADFKKSFILQQNTDDAIMNVIKKTNEESVEQQQYLNMIIILYSFFEELSLPEYSEAYKKQQKLVEKFHNFKKNYENSLRQLQQVCSNIQITKN